MRSLIAALSLICALALCMLPMHASGQDVVYVGTPTVTYTTCSGGVCTTGSYGGAYYSAPYYSAYQSPPAVYQSSVSYSTPAAPSYSSSGYQQVYYRRGPLGATTYRYSGYAGGGTSAYGGGFYTGGVRCYGGVCY